MSWGTLVASKDLSCFFVWPETVSYPDGYWSIVRGHRAVVLSLADSRWRFVFIHILLLRTVQKQVVGCPCQPGVSLNRMSLTVRCFGVIHEGTRDEPLKTSVLYREATKSPLHRDSSVSLMHQNSSDLGSLILIVPTLTPFLQVLLLLSRVLSVWTQFTEFLSLLR